MRKILFSLLLILLSVYGISSADVESTVRTLDHDGLTRTYSLYVPAQSPTGIVILLHSVASSGRAMEVITNFNRVADERGFIVAYPDSARFYWDDGRVSAGVNPDEGTVDDLGFLNSLAQALKDEFSVEAAFVAGMGNGGSMTFALACHTPENFSGFGIVSSAMWNYHLEQCPEAGNPVNLLSLHGDKDPTYPLEGRAIDPEAPASPHILSQADIQTYWTERNQCDIENVSNFAQTTVMLFNACANETITAFHTVLGGGVNWFSMGNNTINRFGVDASQVLGAFFAGDEDWHLLTVQETLPAAGVEARSFVLYVPNSYDASQPTPLVLNLHGRTTNGAAQAYSSGFNAVADKEGFLVLYPDGLGNQWNYTRNLPFYNELATDDEGFLDTLLDDLAKDLNIDTNRVYVTGLSNGGFMTQRLACTRHERFAAFASVAAAAPFGLTLLCDENRPIPVPFMLIQGTADPINPWEGLTATNPEDGSTIYAIAPTENTMGFWATNNGCSTESERTNLPNTDPDSSVSFWNFIGCPEGAEVQLYGVIGGGHTWPGIHDFESDILGEVNMDFNASEAIWNFFKNYSLETRPVPAPPSYEQEQFIIEQLQTGAYTLVYTVNFAQEVDCDTEGGHLSPEIQTVLAETKLAFETLKFTFHDVSSSGDCRGVEAAELLYGGETRHYDELELVRLQFLLANPPMSGSMNLLIVDTAQMQAMTRSNIGHSQFAIMEGNGEAFRMLTMVPANGWLSLADIYTEIQARESSNP